MAKQVREDEYTGIEAQRDPEFAAESQVQSDLDEFDALEKELESIESFDADQFAKGFEQYEKFVVLPKRELLQFLRAVEPLTKVTTDAYGKSVQIASVDKDSVVLNYNNLPFRVSMRITNKSQKLIDSFCVQISLLKKLVTEAFAAVVLVQEGEEYSVAICDSLMFLETVPLSPDQFKMERKKLELALDKELSMYTFKKLGSVLSTSDRSSEKIIIVKSGLCFFNTGVFSAKVNSPFQDKEAKFLLFKSAVDLIGVLSEIAKLDIKYAIEDDILHLEADGLIYCQVPITTKIEDHYSPSISKALDFEANISIVNDSIGRLVNLIKSLDYLSNIVTISFTKEEMILEFTNQNNTKKSAYKFQILEGNDDSIGSMRVSADVLKPYLDATGTDVRYAFNEMGLCMENERGRFLVRKTS